MAGDTVVIRAEMLSDIPEKAAESAAAVKGLGEEIKTATGAASTSSAQLGKHLDTVNERTERVANGGAKKLKKAYDDLYESGGRLRESVSSLGESIKYHMQYPMQQLTYIAEGAAVGMVAFGLTTASSLQQANLALSSFTGNATIASTAVTQLRQLQSAVPIGGLTSAYETLSQGGVGQSQLLPMIRALSGISAVSLNPANSMQSMSAAVAAMSSTGLLTTSDVNSFSGAGVDVWGMLARETGQTPAELRMRFLRAGTPMAVPGSFMGDLTSSSQATGGTSAYEKTWAGQMGQMKKTVGDMLGVFETPLGNALAGASSKIDTWATGTEARFKQLGGSIGQEWSSGNMGGLGHTLANIVGDPKLAGGVTTMATALHGFSQIVTQSVIPTAHELLTIANPALHGLADVLGFLGEHKGITDAMLVTFGGFIVLSKVAQWTSNAVTMFRGFNTLLESKGAIAAISAYSRGLEGLASAQEAVAATAGAETAAESGGMLGGRLGGAGGMLGKLGLIGGGAGLTTMGMTSKLGWGSALETVGGDAAIGAGIGSFLPGPGTLIGGLLGGGIGAATDLFRLGRSQTSHSTSIRTVNITVPGAGNPNKVANAIPKALNDQIASYQAQAARRGAGA